MWFQCAVRTIAALVGLAIGCSCGRFGFEARSQDAANADGDTTLELDARADASFASTAFGYWKLDDGSGVTATDSSGNGHPMNLVAGAAWGTGMFSGAVSSDGVDDYLEVPNLDLSTTAAVTVSLWSSRNYTDGPRDTLFELSTNVNNFMTGFGLFPDDNTTCASPGHIYAFMRGNVGFVGYCYPQPTSGVWHHLVAIFDKSQPAAGEVVLFVDGVQQTPTQMAGAADNTNSFGAHSLYLLSRGGTNEFNSGSVDEITIFDRALSAAERAML